MPFSSKVNERGKEYLFFRLSLQIKYVNSQITGPAEKFTSVSTLRVLLHSFESQKFYFAISESRLFCGWIILAHKHCSYLEQVSTVVPHDKLVSYH